MMEMKLAFLAKVVQQFFLGLAKLNHSGSVPKKSDRWCLNYKIYPKILLSNKISNKPFNYIRRYNLFLNY